MTARELHTRTLAGEKAVVLGLRLVPFTIGHARLLDFLGCALMRDAGEVALAVVVCSLPQDRVLHFLASRLMPLRLLVWKWYLGAWDAQAAQDQMAAYFKRHTQLPLQTRRGKFVPCPIPGHQMLRTKLLMTLNYAPSDIDGTPFLQALWDLRTLDAIRGTVEVADRTDDDQEELERETDWEQLEAGVRAALSKEAA